MSVHQSRSRMMGYIATTRSDDFCVAILSSWTQMHEPTHCKGEGLGEPIRVGGLCDILKNLLAKFEIFGFIKTIPNCDRGLHLQLQLYLLHHQREIKRDRFLIHYGIVSSKHLWYVTLPSKVCANSSGTEQDKVNCSFYYKIGACRHG